MLEHTCLLLLLLAISFNHYLYFLEIEIVVTCPQPIIERNLDRNSLVLPVHYPDATAVGGQGDITLVYSIPSGSDFYLGETTVAVTAVDSTDHSSHCTFPVFVVFEGMDLFPELIQDEGLIVGLYRLIEIPGCYCNNSI